jgi:type IV pilus assembly protein PilC
MPRFSYVAKDINGVTHKGIMEVPDEATLRTRLKHDSLFATSIKPIREFNINIPFLTRITSQEIAEFAEQFAIMIEAGLSLAQCLVTLIEGCKNQKLRKIIDQIRQDVESGFTLADAIEQHPLVFTKLFVSLVKAGEVSGNLPKSLRQIADNLDKDQEIRQKIKSAMAYPQLVGIACFAVIIFILVYIIPRFAKIYDSLNITLPAVTLMFVAISRFILHYWWSIPIVIGILLFTYYMLKRSDSALLDRMKLGMPVFGELYRKTAISRFVYVLSSLQGSGVPIIQSLEVAQDVMNNKIIGRVIDSAKISVTAGGRIKDALSASKMFPIIVMQMISVGEETGGLSLSLEKSAKYLDREVDLVIKRLITRVEPGLTMIIGVVVALIAAAIYMPIFDVVKIVNK